MLMQLLAIALGGALGSLLRFLTSTWVYGLTGRGFPFGTLTVNIVGCLAMGFLYVALIERSSVDPIWRAALLVGLLGGYTTFSTFSIETLNLIEQGALIKAATNALSSVLFCLVATWVGILIARQL
jgi:fluoride exporter